jgi:hypothetical protein
LQKSEERLITILKFQELTVNVKKIQNEREPKLVKKNIENSRKLLILKTETFYNELYRLESQLTVRKGHYRKAINNILINESIEMFNNWFNRWDRFRTSFNEINGDGQIICKLPNRYSKTRIKKLENRINYLKFKYRKTKSVLLTLTYNPEKFEWDLVEISRNANKELHRFMILLKYHFEKEGRRFPEYLKTSEFMKNGLIHFHIVFFGVARLFDWREIEKYWKNGYIWINRTKDKKKIRNAISYVAKYITKTLDVKNKKHELTRAMNWLFDIRNYSNSRGLIYPLYYKKEKPEYRINAVIEILTKKKGLTNLTFDEIQRLFDYLKEVGKLKSNYKIGG